MNLEKLYLRRNLPLVGILAFSLCSVWSLYQLFTKSAAHPTPLFWLPALLVEGVTAWAVYNAVEQARRVTQSNISKQDRRFYGLMLAAFAAVAIPTLAVSTWANTLEFGHLLLGALFPVCSVGCAVGAALPDVMGEYAQKRDKELAERRREKAEARQRKAEERKLRAELGQTGTQIVYIIKAEPRLTHDEIAQKVGKTRQTVAYHMQKLAEKQIIKGGNGRGYEVLVDLPKGG